MTAVLDLAVPTVVLALVSWDLEDGSDGVSGRRVKAAVKSLFGWYLLVLVVSFFVPYVIASVLYVPSNPLTSTGDNGGQLFLFFLLFMLSMIPIGLLYIALRVVELRAGGADRYRHPAIPLFGLALYAGLGAMVVASTRSLAAAAALGAALVAVAAYSRLDRAVGVLRLRLRLFRVAPVYASLPHLIVAFKRARQRLVLEEGRLSDRALQLYYLLEEARLVARFLVDPDGRLDGEELEAAMASPPREAVSRVDEELLERLGEALEMHDPQGLRIYRAQDGAFHVAAGDVIDVPIPRPDAAASALYDVITRLRAEIERETGRPYRPLVLVKFLKDIHLTTLYAVDPVGLLDELTEHLEEYRDVLSEEAYRELEALVRGSAGPAAQPAPSVQSQEEEQRGPRKDRRRRGRGRGALPPGPGVN